MKFIESIYEIAKSDVKTIVLPESSDIRTIKAASVISKEGIARIILIGNQEKILSTANGIDISKVIIIDPESYEKFDQIVAKFYELRKSKGITMEQAKQTMSDPLYFGVMLVQECLADGMVAGAINSTANTLRPALQILKTAPGVNVVSSFFIMEVPDCELGHNGMFLFSDCALLENPDAQQLSEIALATSKSFESLFKSEPKVAMLSYSTYKSADSILTRKVVEATAIAKQKAPNLSIDGELQLDAAIISSIGAKKAPGSSVAGSANVLIFPDLNSGNIGYKLVERLAKASAYGPVTQGLAKPVNDLSRGCSSDDIVAVVALTAIQAQALK